jgi:hypothetical protein
MINTLYKVAQQTLPPRQRPEGKDAVEFIREAVQNRAEYKRVWDIAQEKIQEHYADDPKALAELEGYFADYLEKPFTDNQLLKALRKVLKDNGIDLADVVYHGEEIEEKTKQFVIGKLIEESGITGSDAAFLTTFANKTLDEMISDTNVRELQRIFKDHPKTAKTSAFKKLLGLANLGAFAEPEYASYLRARVNVSRITADEMGVKIADIVKRHYTEADNLGISLLEKILKETPLDGDEALALANYVYAEFNAATSAKKESILSGTFKERVTKKKRELYQRIIELSNLGGITSKKYSPYIAKKLGLPALTPDLQKRIMEYTDKIQTLDDTTEEGKDQKEFTIALMMADIARQIPSVQAMSPITMS